MNLRRMGIVLLGITMGISMAALGVRVLPASHHLDQAPGTTETYTLTVLNDTDVAEDLTLYVGDWQRFEDGEHDWGVPINSARWIFDRSFTAGERLEVVYLLKSDTGDGLTIRGTFESQSPQSSNTTSGLETIASDVPQAASLPSSSDVVWVERVIDSIDANGAVTMRLTIECRADFEGLVVYETTSERVEFTSVDDAGARFDTINRSNAGWLTLSHDRLVLQPDESRDIVLTVDMPQDAEGTTWAAVFVQSQPQSTDEGGTRVISIYRTAIKVYTTAVGSDVFSGHVLDVQVEDSESLALFALFENTGNVELVVTGEVQVIDRTGQRVRDLDIDEFKVLPGAKRIVVVADTPDVEPLAPDIYQAVVSFDYGGDNPVVGVRGFRIR